MRLAVLTLTGLALSMQPSTSGLIPNPDSHMTAVEQPTGRQIERCFRGLQAGVSRISFQMHCTLDERGTPRQCEVSGMSEAQNRMLQGRVQCLADQFRFVRDDGGPTLGMTTTQTVTFLMP